MVAQEKFCMVAIVTKIMKKYENLEPYGIITLHA